MIGAKYLEVLNFMLTNSTRHYDFVKREYKMKEHIQIANPVSKEYDTTRTLLLPGLLETLLFNRSEEKPIRIFEVGEIIEFDTSKETGGAQELHLSAVTYHENADFSEIRSLLDHLTTSLGITNDIEVKPANNPTYLEGRTGDILYKGDSIGILGEIHPEVILNFNLEFPVVALELNLNNLPIEKLLK